MRMQVQKGDQCMLYALAMVMSIPASELMLQIPEGRSLHPQELMDAMLPDGYSLVTVEADPYCTDPVALTQARVYADPFNRITRYARGARGILLLQKDNTAYHAVAWDGTCVYDPHGKISKGIPENTIAFLRLVQL